MSSDRFSDVPLEKEDNILKEVSVEKNKTSESDVKKMPVDTRIDCDNIQNHLNTVDVSPSQKETSCVPPIANNNQTDLGKVSLIAWWIIAVMSLFLWYRNIAHDRVVAAFAFTLGLVQLISYGVANQINLSQADKLLFLTLWLQCFILSLGLYVYTRDNFSMIMFIIFSVILLLAVIYVINNHDDFINRSESILGSFSFIYFLGIIIPFIVLAFHQSNIGIYMLLLYIVVVGYYLTFSLFNVALSYIMVGFTFLAWIIGIFYQI